MTTHRVRQTREPGGAHRQFIINSALLSLIDPVRGEPTKGVLEGHPDDDVSRSHQLKERFLDSFALICSTSSSGKETASAVCMEQHQSTGTTLRVARNRGLSQQDLKKLSRVMRILIAAANGGKSSMNDDQARNSHTSSDVDKLPMQAETEVLEEVVDLDQDRIMSLLEKLERAGIRDIFQLAISRLCSGERREEVLLEPCFGHWIKTCPFTGTFQSLHETSQLPSLVKWASQARWVYPKHLEVLLALDPNSTPHWMETFYKIARYWGATKSMVKLAVKQPAVFANIQIQDVRSPAQRPFSLSQKGTSLREALQRLVKQDCDITMEKLAQRWETDDVEGKFFTTCRLKLTLHAEMQLLDFYDHNPDLTPQLRLMGTSKKACYLCHEFLLLHPLCIRVSACHQKIYPTWMPPPCHDIPGVARNKLLWKLSKHVERVVVRELKTGLVGTRRPRNKDSTAGPSVTETATIPTEVFVRHIGRQNLPFQGDSM